MKILSLFFLFLSLHILSGCCFFTEEGPAPETPPFRIPDSGKKEKMTISQLTDKMTDKLSISIVSRNLTGKNFRKVRIIPGKGETELLAITARKLAASGLIFFTDSPNALFFTTGMDENSWYISIESPFPKMLLLKEEIFFREP